MRVSANQDTYYVLFEIIIVYVMCHQVNLLIKGAMHDYLVLQVNIYANTGQLIPVGDPPQGDQVIMLQCHLLVSYNHYLSDWSIFWIFYGSS